MSTTNNRASEPSKETGGGQSNPASVPSQSSKPETLNLNEVYREYGGKYHFLLAYGLKMWNHDDVKEGEAIARGLLESRRSG